MLRPVPIVMVCCVSMAELLGTSTTPAVANGYRPSRCSSQRSIAGAARSCRQQVAVDGAHPVA